MPIKSIFSFISVITGSYKVELMTVLQADVAALDRLPNTSEHAPIRNVDQQEWLPDLATTPSTLLLYKQCHLLFTFLYWNQVKQLILGSL